MSSNNEKLGDKFDEIRKKIIELKNENTGNPQIEFIEIDKLTEKDYKYFSRYLEGSLTLGEYKEYFEYLKKEGGSFCIFGYVANNIAEWDENGKMVSFDEYFKNSDE